MGIGLTNSVLGAPRTVRSIVKRAYEIAHVLAPDEKLSTPHSVEGLMILNELIEDANIDAVFSTHEHELAVPLVDGKLTYTISSEAEDPGADVKDVRPIGLLSAYVRRDGQDFPVTVTHAKVEYDSIRNKSASHGLACFVYYQPTYPSGTLYVYGAGGAPGVLMLTTSSQLPYYTAFEEQIRLPTGYAGWMQYKLAYYLAQDYHKVWSQQNADILDGKEHAIRRNNIKPLETARTGLSELSAANCSTYDVMNDRG